jgi:PPOX class probable F420-dependent enzyme
VLARSARAMLAWPARRKMLDHLPAYDAVMPQPGGPGPGRSRSLVPLSTDEGTHFGARAARHLREDPVIWLTTVSATGASAPNTVWFFWNGAATVPMYSLPDADQVGHLEANPKVSLNFVGASTVGGIVVLPTVAALRPDLPPADQDPAYLAK